MNIEETIMSELQNEATLTVGSFTGKTDDGSNADSVNEPKKKGLRGRIKIKVIGPGRYGGDKVSMTGSEEDLMAYAKRHLGGEGDTLSAVQSTVEAKLDPVGKGDDDIDNDGDTDSSDEYLKNRRKKIGQKIDSAKLKEMARASKV